MLGKQAQHFLKTGVEDTEPPQMTSEALSTQKNWDIMRIIIQTMLRLCVIRKYSIPVFIRAIKSH